YVPSATAVMTAAGRRLALGRTVAVQLAASFLNRLTPGGIGGMGTNARYLEPSGLTRAEAVTAVALPSVAGVTVHAVLLATSAVLFDWRGLPSGRLPRRGHVLLVVLGGLIVLGLILRTPLGRR